MSTKNGTWEDYLEQMRSISSTAPLTKALSTIQLDPENIEDQYFVFSTCTQGLLVLNLRYYLSTHNHSTDIIDDFVKSHQEQTYALLDYSNLNIRHFSPDFQEKYCESILQLYCVFSIADEHYKDEELDIIKEILSACTTPNILEDIKFLLGLSGFIPKRLYSFENHDLEEQDKEDKDILLRKALGYFPVLTVNGGVVVNDALSIDWTDLAKFFKEYKDYILFALRGLRDWIKRRRKKIEEKKKEELAKQKSKQKEKEKEQKKNEKNGFVGGVPKTPAPSVKEQPQVQDHPSLPLVPFLIRSYENTIIYGETKIGKTFLGVQLATDLARGGSSTLFPDEEFSVAPQKVIYYNYEQDRDNIIEKFKDLPYKLDNLIMIDQVVCRQNLKTAALLLNDITLRLNSYPEGTNMVVFIDNLNRVVENANAKSQVNYLTDELEYQILLAKKKGCSLANIILAHTNKSGELEGAGSLNQRAKCIISFEKIDSDHRLLRVIQSNSKHSEDPYILRWCKYPDYGHSCFVFDRIENDTDSTTPEQTEKTTKEKVIELAEKGLRNCEIAKELDIDPHLVSYHLREYRKKHGKGK